jgi:hypothetical protein
MGTAPKSEPSGIAYAFRTSLYRSARSSAGCIFISRNSEMAKSRYSSASARTSPLPLAGEGKGTKFRLRRRCLDPGSAHVGRGPALRSSRPQQPLARLHPRAGQWCVVPVRLAWPHQPFTADLRPNGRLQTVRRAHHGGGWGPCQFKWCSVQDSTRLPLPLDELQEGSTRPTLTSSTTAHSDRTDTPRPTP